MTKQFGAFATIDGLISEIPESEIKLKEEEVTNVIKEDMIAKGHDPNNFYYESIVRQSYHNGDEEYPKAWDEPIFKNNVPIITVGIKATEK